MINAARLPECGSSMAAVARRSLRRISAPFKHSGPDIVTNGIALSGTAHWMFDRGLISLSDDLQILISRHANDPDGVRGFVNPTGRAIAPLRSSDRPHPHFLSWHRTHCFKQ
jgi:putative restriction endonuclease